MPAHRKKPKHDHAPSDINNQYIHRDDCNCGTCQVCYFTFTANSFDQNLCPANRLNRDQVAIVLQEVNKIEASHCIIFSNFVNCIIFIIVLFVYQIILNDYLPNMNATAQEFCTCVTFICVFTAFMCCAASDRRKKMLLVRQYLDEQNRNVWNARGIHFANLNWKYIHIQLNFHPQVGYLSPARLREAQFSMIYQQPMMMQQGNQMMQPGIQMMQPGMNQQQQQPMYQQPNVNQPLMNM